MPDRLVDMQAFQNLAAGILLENHRLRFKVRGSSMRPFLRDGDLVEVQPVSPDSIKPGEVVLCKLPGERLVVHRVVQADAENLLMQGDALPHPDGRIPRQNVLGRVVAFTRQNRRVELNPGLYTLLAAIWIRFRSLRRLGLRVAGKLKRTLFRLPTSEE